MPSLRSLARIGEDFHYKKRQDLKKSVEKVEGQWRGSVHFAGLQNRYFCVYGIVPQEQGEPIEGTIRLSGDQEFEAQSWAIDLPAQRGVGDEIAVARLDLLIGPQEAELLQSYGQGLEKSMDLGWKLFRPLSEIVLWGHGVHAPVHSELRRDHHHLLDVDEAAVLPADRRPRPNP